MKLCPTCLISKPSTQFYRNKLDSTGLASHCKDCLKKARQKRNLEKRQADQKAGIFPELIYPALNPRITALMTVQDLHELMTEIENRGFDIEDRDAIMKLIHQRLFEGAN